MGKASREKVTKVFWISLVIALLFVSWGVFLPENLTVAMETAKSFFMVSFGWFYQLTATFFLLFALYLIISPYGKLKLGKDDDKPEFSNPSWFAMLFSAGMGIGLLFFGVSEPISHFTTPPLAEGGTAEAAREALRYTYLHWGFHAWAIYATIALALAYYKFRKNLPGLMSATLYPLLGDRVKGPMGVIIDVIAVFATIFGVAASLGLGAQQINSGLSYLTGIPNQFSIQLIIISIITVLFMISAGTGLERGIKYLSNANLLLALGVFFIVLFVGPTVFLLNLLTTTFGGYIQNLPSMGLRLAPFNSERAAWTQSWTIFYWAWWIAWAPFVGTFIARVSKGRTVREFVVAVLVIPSIVCIIWFAVFGGTAIYFDFNFKTNISGHSLETALFYVYKQLPLTLILTIMTLFLITTFFITSADSATFVLGMMTTNGSLEPSNVVKYTWGIILSLSAIVLMLSGGLAAMQTAIIVSAFPLAIIVILTCIALLRSFRHEIKKPRAKEFAKKP